MTWSKDAKSSLISRSNRLGPRELGFWGVPFIGTRHTKNGPVLSTGARRLRREQKALEG